MSVEKNQNSYLEHAAASDESIQQVHARLAHQKPEKADGNPTFPLLLLGVMCSVIFVGAVYLAHYSSRFDPMIFNENQQPTKQVAAQPGGDPMLLIGRRVFRENCALCHQQNGQGTPNVYPPLAGSEWVNDPAHTNHIIKIVISGLQGPIKVAGKDFNNVMAPLGGALNDNQIAAVLTYVRQEWGNTGAEPVTADQVAAIRAETGSRSPWTVDELLKTP